MSNFTFSLHELDPNNGPELEGLWGSFEPNFGKAMPERDHHHVETLQDRHDPEEPEIEVFYDYFTKFNGFYRALTRHYGVVVRDQWSSPRTWEDLMDQACILYRVTTQELRTGRITHTQRHELRIMRRRIRYIQDVIQEYID